MGSSAQAYLMYGVLVDPAHDSYERLLNDDELLNDDVAWEAEPSFGVMVRRSGTWDSDGAIVVGIELAASDWEPEVVDYKEPGKAMDAAIDGFIGATGVDLSDLPKKLYLVPFYG